MVSMAGSRCVSYVVLLALILALQSCADVAYAQTSSEARLMEYLMARYKEEFRLTRPVVDAADNLTVAIGLTLIDIIDFDHSSGVATFHFFDKRSWRDDHLRWDPRQFGGLQSMAIPCDKVWKPDIVLYNNQDMNEDRMLSQIIAYSDGTVLWVPRTKYRIRCVTSDDDADWLCKFKFGSWVLNGQQLDPVVYMDESGIEMGDFLLAENWHIVENMVNKTVKYYDCCVEPYPNVSFYLKLRSLLAHSHAAHYSGSIVTVGLLCIVAKIFYSVGA